MVSVFVALIGIADSSSVTTSPVIVYEHPFEAYLDPSIIVNSVLRWRLEIHGGRMIVGCQPERQSEFEPGEPTFYLRVWRL